MTQSAPEKPIKPPAANNLLALTLRAVVVVIGVAALVATLYTASPPVGLLANGLGDSLSSAMQGAALTPTPDWPTPTPRPVPNIGLVAGHSGGQGQVRDPGAVCPPALGGIFEVDVNETVAALTNC